MKPGAKYFEWEGRGVPVRLELGPRDLAENKVIVARRTGGKAPSPMTDIGVTVTEVLEELQQQLFEDALERREEHSHRNLDRSGFIELMEGQGGFVYGGFCGEARCESEIKEKTKATIRVLPDSEFRSPEPQDKCMWCGTKAVSEAVWAKAY